MIYLLLSVFSSTILGFIFRLFPRFGIHTFQAIVVNYFVCVLCAWVALGFFPVHGQIVEAAWFPYAITLGFIFVAGFNMAAFTIQQFGITIGTVMQKMSIIFSATAAIIFYQEAAGVFKLLGIAVSVAAIWLTNKPGKEALERLATKAGWLLIFPILTLLLSGVIEILFFHVEQITGESSDLSFVATLFGMAGLLGLLVMVPALLVKKMQWQFRNIIAGFLLGVPNFFSIYFLLKLLGTGWGGSVVFPVNNVCIIALSSLSAVLILNEKLSKANIVGVVLSAIAILLIGFGS